MKPTCALDSAWSVLMTCLAGEFRDREVLKRHSTREMCEKKVTEFSVCLLPNLSIVSEEARVRC